MPKLSSVSMMFAAGCGQAVSSKHNKSCNCRVDDKLLLIATVDKLVVLLDKLRIEVAKVVGKLKL